MKGIMKTMDGKLIMKFERKTKYLIICEIHSEIKSQAHTTRFAEEGER
jgi:hypothetical protein